MLRSRPMDAASWTVLAASFRSLRAEIVQLRERLASSDWTAAEDTAVQLADALDSGDGGRRLVELASRLDRTVAEVRRRAARLRRVEVDGGERRRPEVLVRRLTQPAARR